MKKMMLMICALSLAVATEAQETKTYKVQDMHCGGCANKIRTVLANEAGVDSVTFDLVEHTATVNYSASKPDFGDIQDRIEKAGYSPLAYSDDPNVAYAYLNLAKGAATPAAQQAVAKVKGVEEVYVNPRRSTMAVAYSKKKTNAEKLVKTINKQGIDAKLPEPHVCKDM